MKRTVILLAMLLFIAIPLSSQTTGFIESQNTVKSGSITPALDVYVNHKINKKIGVFAWFITDKNWGEGYAGLSWYPKSWMSINLGAGVEHAKNPWRICESVWIGKNKDSLLVILEHGGSGHWWRSVYDHQFKNRAGLGIHGEAFMGWGPRIQYSIPKTNLVIWSTYCANPKGGKPSSIFGFRYNF